MKRGRFYGKYHKFQCPHGQRHKKQCESLYSELGVNLTTAINVFLRQSIRIGGFPFDVRLDQLNKETIAAMLEAERIAHDPSVKRYSDVEEALRELKR